MGLSKRSGWRVVWMIFCAGACATVARAGETGRDVEAAFARAKDGAPLRYVAIGGSITQASGPGWVGDWLRESFPRSEVRVVNSGMSGTGSSLGIFRLERDVLAHQPDLVAIEYCVNDGGLTDEEAIRYVETMVVRLKSAPHPPAIVILEAAARTGVNLSRHRRVARHYGLLEVDFQAAVDARLAAEGRPWSTFFGDEVHPNRAGHAFYAETMRRALAPLLERARAAESPAPEERATLPAPLSVKPLLLDARMVPLQGHVDPPGEWRGEAARASDWGRFFQGAISAERPGAALRVPFRGTMAGLFYAREEGYGTFWVNVDGRTPLQVSTKARGGFSSVLAETELPAGEHVLNVVLSGGDEGGDESLRAEPVKLGYLLVAGETGSGRVRAAEGPFDVGTLRALRFATLPAAAWSWAGPFPAPSRTDGRAAVDAIAAIAIPFVPEWEDGVATATGGPPWRAAEGEGGLLDFRALTRSDAAAVVYARTEWTSRTGGPALLSVEADYYARLWLNGERVLTLDGPHRTPVFLPVRLRAGANTFVMKIGAGSAGFGARLRVAPYAERGPR